MNGLTITTAVALAACLTLVQSATPGSRRVAPSVTRTGRDACPAFQARGWSAARESKGRYMSLSILYLIQEWGKHCHALPILVERAGLVQLVARRLFRSQGFQLSVLFREQHQSATAREIEDAQQDVAELLNTEMPQTHVLHPSLYGETGRSRLTDFIEKRKDEFNRDLGCYIGIAIDMAKCARHYASVTLRQSIIEYFIDDTHQTELLAQKLNRGGYMPTRTRLRQEIEYGAALGDHIFTDAVAAAHANFGEDSTALAVLLEKLQSDLRSLVALVLNQCDTDSRGRADITSQRNALCETRKMILKFLNLHAQPAMAVVTASNAAATTQKATGQLSCDAATTRSSLAKRLGVDGSTIARYLRKIGFPGAGRQGAPIETGITLEVLSHASANAGDKALKARAELLLSEFKSPAVCNPVTKQPGI